MGSNSPACSWNDPPVVKFETSTGNLKHLKKRVFSTLDKEERPEPSISAEIELEGKGEVHDDDVKLSDAEMLNFVTSTFKGVLLESSEKCEKTLHEIDRRISLMEKSWDAKLSGEVKQKMVKLAQELSNGNTEAALKIHCYLIVHNVREVKNWMVGVKHIIEMKKENQNLLSTDLVPEGSCT